MSYSYSYTESSTFTLTHAKHMAAKVATDLKRMQRFYGSPSDAKIAEFECKRPYHNVAGKRFVLVPWDVLNAKVGLNVDLVAIAAQLMELVVNPGAESVENLVLLHNDDDVVEQLYRLGR